MSSFVEVLKAAQELPIQSQRELAETLLRSVQAENIQAKAGTDLTSALVPLSDMSIAELQTLAEAMLAPAHQQRLKSLLEKNRAGNLSTQEVEELDTLLDKVDQVALLKARARYTLEKQGAGPAA